MARERTGRTNGNATTEEASGGEMQPVGVMGTAQQAAERLRSSAERAAEHLPDAVASAQVAARESQRALDQMSNPALVVGSSFSLGLSVGFFLSGANRLIVLGTLVPAVAMAATLMGREGERQSSIG